MQLKRARWDVSVQIYNGISLEQWYVTNVEQPLKTMEPDGFLKENHMKTIKQFDRLWTTNDPNGYLTQKPLKAMVTHKNITIATFQNFYHCSSLKVILYNV